MRMMLMKDLEKKTSFTNIVKIALDLSSMSATFCVVIFGNVNIQCCQVHLIEVVKRNETYHNNLSVVGKTELIMI